MGRIRRTSAALTIAAAGRMRQQRRLQKRQKIRQKQPKTDPHPSKKKPFPDRGIARRLAIVPKHSPYLINFFYLCASPFKI